MEKRERNHKKADSRFSPTLTITAAGFNLVKGTKPRRGHLPLVGKEAPPAVSRGKKGKELDQPADKRKQKTIVKVEKANGNKK